VTIEYLQEQKQLKNTLISSSEIFNQSPEECFQYLQGILYSLSFSFSFSRFSSHSTFACVCGVERKILPTPLDPVSVAEFLRRTPFLNKKKIGEYLGSPKPFNQEVCESKQ
jgi:hypothetical protein